jgi:uncharacterized protein (TIGR02001 family)
MARRVRRALRGVVVLLAALLGGVGVCPAADGLQGTLGFTTDYVHRGVSQSAGRAAPQASLTYWHPTGTYGGAWASRVERPVGAPVYGYPPASRTSMELDLYLGFGTRLDADWMVDYKAVAYLFPGDRAPVGYDYLEVSVAAAWRERLFATVAFTPRTAWSAYGGGARRHAALVGELAMQVPVSRWLTGTLGVGQRRFDAASAQGSRLHYEYASASLALQLHRLSLELGHFATDARARRLFGEHLAGRRTVLTVTVNF